MNFWEVSLNVIKEKFENRFRKWKVKKEVIFFFLCDFDYVCYIIVLSKLMVINREEFLY